MKYLKEGVKNPRVKVLMNAAKNRTFEKEGQSDGLVMDAKGRLYFSGVTTGVVTSNPFCLLFDDDPSLFVFSINGLKQNARSLLTLFSDTDFHALLHGSLHFVLHGSSHNHLFQRL